MSGINQHVILAVTRIRAHFLDPLGNAFSPVVGIGFFSETQDKHNVLVTNRHFAGTVRRALRDAIAKTPFVSS